MQAVGPRDDGESTAKTQGSPMFALRLMDVLCNSLLTYIFPQPVVGVLMRVRTVRERERT